MDILKFDLTSVQDMIQKAELRLTRFDGSRPEEIEVFFIPDDEWSEENLTGVQRPEPETPPNSDSLASGKNQESYDVWQSNALTEIIQQETSGDGIRGRFPSLALDHWDRPHISWMDIDETDTTKATIRYGVLNSEQWEIEDIDVLTNVEVSFSEARKSTSLALDANFRPHIAYADKQTIRYATKPFGEWEYTTIAQVSKDLYKGLVVLRLDSNQNPAMVFWQRSESSPGVIRLAQVKDLSTAIHDWLKY